MGLISAADHGAAKAHWILHHAWMAQDASSCWPTDPMIRLWIDIQGRGKIPSRDHQIKAKKNKHKRPTSPNLKHAWNREHVFFQVVLWLGFEAPTILELSLGVILSLRRNMMTPSTCRSAIYADLPISWFQLNLQSLMCLQLKHMWTVD